MVYQLKVVVYGASVTAQKGESGYFQNLENICDFEVVRIPFGASHLHLAGVAMLSKVLDEKPDVCILDWVTPSTKSFPSGVVDRINNILHQHNIFPIWILLPRTDDIGSSRISCMQIRAAASQFVWVKTFIESSFGRGVTVSNLLRDVVHTNSKGARLYSSFLFELLNDFRIRKFGSACLPKSVECEIKEVVPSIIEAHSVIKTDEPFLLRIVANKKCDLTIFLYCEIGPNSPILKVSLKKNGELVASSKKNVVDPWCYYSRYMLIDLPTIYSLGAGEYEIDICTLDLNPFDTISTLKPIEKQYSLDNNNRFLKLQEIIVDKNVNLKVNNEL